MTVDDPPPLAPLIAAQVDYLISHSPLPFKVDQVWSGLKDGSFSDRFTLSIPYCLDHTKWDLVYNALHPSVPPDVVFAPEDEDFNPLASIAQAEVEGQAKSCLVDWNGKDPSRLMAFIQELRDLYVDYQKKRVSKLDDARVKFEMSTMLTREGIEVCLISGPDRPEEVRFAVPLLVNMDFSKLVIGCPWKLKQHIFLQAIFPVTSWNLSNLTPRIRLVPSLDLKRFFSVEEVKLSAWPDGMCMAEYLPPLEESIRLQVVEAVASIGARRRFIEALAPLFGRPLEADPVFCRKATVLSSSGIFVFLVHFSIPTQFPRHQPVLLLQSSSHFSSHGAPIMSRPINDYPWSPRWDVTEMVERTYDFLVDESLNFKRYCNENTQQC